MKATSSNYLESVAKYQKRVCVCGGGEGGGSVRGGSETFLVLAKCFTTM